MLIRSIRLLGGAAIVNLGEGALNADSAEAAVLTTQQTNANRAVAAYNALQKYFYVQDGTSLFRETYPWSGGNKYSFLWPFSRALVGTLSLAGVPTNLTAGTSYVSA